MAVTCEETYLLTFLVYLINLPVDVISHGTNKNVLFLLGDDAGFETQIYGNKACPTPALDKLAKRSLVFNNAFTSVSSCSPSRSVILSGLPQHQNGIYGLYQDPHHFLSFKEVQSIPLLVKKAGVFTGIIGKKHVGPAPVYKFDYEITEENFDILQAGRNISFIVEHVQTFLRLRNKTQPFFLYIGFHDPHRSKHTHPEYGAFCEKFGLNGSIPGYKPILFDPGKVEVPYFVQDTPAARRDIAAQYTAINRMDQGIGLILQELQRTGVMNDTLIMYTSDNGIPFPNGRTNLYDSGVREPFLLSSPAHPETWGQKSDDLVSHVDILPTILDWFGIELPSYHLNGKPVVYTGKSLLKSQKHSHDAIFGSHNLHEVTMYYPMRSVRTAKFKLIKNLNFGMPFSIDQDFFISDTFQDLLNRTQKGIQTHWFKSLKEYYYREPWELYDINSDPMELKNLYHDSRYENIIKELNDKLYRWQNLTADPWICGPGSVLEDKGLYKNSPQCLSMNNGL